MIVKPPEIGGQLCESISHASKIEGSLGEERKREFHKRPDYDFFGVLPNIFLLGQRRE